MTNSFETHILGILDVPNKTVNSLSPEEYADLVSLYGKEAVDNDLMVDMLVLYPEKEIHDAEGRIVTITENDLYEIADASNKALKRKLGHGLAKAKSWIRGQNMDNYNYVTITEDHDLDVSKRMGYSNGKFEVKEINGVPYLHAKAHIIRPDAKIKIKQQLYREISATVRKDNTFKEISFVSNPALHHAGIFSESKNKPQPKFNDKIYKIEKISKDLKTINDKLDNEKKSLEFQLKEQNINNMLNKLLKHGKILPRDTEFHRQTLLKLDGDGAQRVHTSWMLGETVMKLNKVETRNHNFMQGVIMREDFEQTLEKLQSGVINFAQLAEQTKGKFAEKDDATEPDKDKGQYGEDMDSEDLKKCHAKLAAMLKEDEKDDEEVKKLKSKLSACLTESDAVMDTKNTDGDLPDNAKLSESIGKHKERIKELEKNQSKLIKQLGSLNDNITNAVNLMKGGK